MGSNEASVGRKHATRRKTLVVTPSVRSFPYAYFSGIEGADHIIIDDMPGVDRSELRGMPHLTFATREFVLDHLGGERDPVLFPSGNPSCKNFGIWWAVKNRYSTVVLLDDDTSTIDADYLGMIPVGKSVRAKGYETPSGWYNTMAQLFGETTQVYSRGYPYEYRGEPLIYDDVAVPITSSFNAGMWCKTPDINGIDKARMDPDYVTSISEKGTDDHGKPWWVEESRMLSPAYVYLKPGQKLPLSIMNVQFDAKLAPAFWQPPDFPMDKFRVRRHDDVWSMYVLKKIMDYLGDVATVGHPMVAHMKSADPMREILSEHATNMLQASLEQLVDRAAEVLPMVMPNDYATAAAIMGEAMIGMSTRMGFRGHTEDIMLAYSKGVNRWAEMFL